MWKLDQTNGKFDRAIDTFIIITSSLLLCICSGVLARLELISKQGLNYIIHLIDWLCFMTYQTLFNTKSSLYIYIKYIWFINEWFVGNIFKQAWKHLCT